MPENAGNMGLKRRYGITGQKATASKVHKTDGWKLGESSPKDADEPYVGSYAALLSEQSLKSEGEVSNSRMGM